MTKLYFLGGSGIRKRESKSIYKKAFSDAGKSPIVLVFPWTREKEKKKYRKIIRDFFKDLGANKTIFAELTDSLKKIKKKIESSNIIYLPGGNPRILIKRIKKRGINKLLRKYDKVMIGNSAGALAFCNKYVVIKGQDNEPKTKLVKGLGLADISVTVHYGSKNPRHSGLGESAIKKLSKNVNVKIYAISEKSALIHDGKDLKFIGDIYQFYKSKKVKLK